MNWSKSASTAIGFLRRLFLPLLYRFNPGDITISNHYTQDRLRLHAYKHKGYWFHGKRREQETMRLFEVLVPAGGTVVEVGGHIGYVTQYFSKLVGSTGHVYVFEPGPNNLAYIRVNTYGKTNVSLIEKAAGSANESRIFYIEDITGLNNSFERQHVSKRARSNMVEARVRESDVLGVVVDVIRLDDFAREQGIRPDFVKIDVEAFEVEVLMGMKRLLSQFHPLIMVEVDPGNRKEVFQLVERYGYLTFTPKDLRLVERPEECPYNMFCVHRTTHGDVLARLGLKNRKARIS